MTIELTEVQRQAISKGEPVRLNAPEVGADVVVMRADEFEELREVLEEEREKQAIAAVGLSAAQRWAQENAD